MLEKLSKMSIRAAMIDLEGRAPLHGELPRWLLDVASKAKISFRTARSLWNNEIKNPEDHLAAKEIRRLAKIAMAQREARDLATQFENIAERMNANDPDFYCTDAATLVEAARILRGMDRS
ncbi:MAG: hypothetical protein J0G33_02805 [Afipia felis]|nr:hypothetical protein [Afipia felis]